MKPLVIVGEAWGTNEERIKSHFVGATGVELLKLLDESGCIDLTSADRDYIYQFWNTSDPNMVEMVWRMHPEIYRTNVFNFHPHANRIESLCGSRAEGINGFPALLKSKYVRAEFIPELERLGNEIMEVDPNLIVALGNTPFWALCGLTGIKNMRGTTRLSTHAVEGFKVLPTYHPAVIFRQWELRPTVVVDLAKASREREFPEVRRPKCEIWIKPEIEDIERFYREHIIPCDRLAVDIETAGNQITCIGFAPSPRISLVIPFFSSRRKTGSYWTTKTDEIRAWGIVRDILGNPSIKKTFQNGLYDIAFLWRSMGIPVFGAEHDTMLLHHALQPESLKGLGFLGSIYTDHGPWKVERKGTRTIKKDE